MAFQSAFKERLETMEITRNHRLSLLNDEKQLQRAKSLLLSAKNSNIRFLEQKCLFLDKKLASVHFKISSLKSEFEFLDRNYQNSAQQLRDLKVEVEELEELEKERDKFYELKCCEMNDFRDEIEKYVQEIGNNVEELRCKRDKLNFCYLALQESSSMVQNCGIHATEMGKLGLLALKQKVTNSLESNKRNKAMLQEQLQSLR